MTQHANASTLDVRIKAISHEAEGILAFDLVPVEPATTLPAFTAGAHIDLQLPAVKGPLVRSYSLLNDPRETHRYRIAVNRDARSRGGSRHMHEVPRPGERLRVSLPRNDFPLDESAPFNLFIAGGIGITPMLGMIARSQALGTPWRLHYAARTRGHAGFLDLLAGYEGQAGADVRLTFDQEPGGRMLDLQEAIRNMPAGAHVYCCGPTAMLDAFGLATAALAPCRVHREYFSAREEAATAGGFSVELARSGKTLQVPPGRTILDCLTEAGLEPPSSCRQGICGTCEVRVLAGTPDHRDMVLGDAERAANDRMMVCCSGSLSARLVLDL
ncbi:PDR/VanB family oxidoreductase [soil metagenome]